jgi:hypothetical protein
LLTDKGPLPTKNGPLPMNKGHVPKYKGDFIIRPATLSDQRSTFLEDIRRITSVVERTWPVVGSRITHLPRL